MTYDTRTEQRIDAHASRWDDLAKKKMFGGLGWLVAGNLAFGAWKSSLIVRCGPQRQEELLRERHVSRFDVTGRPMKGWLLVAAPGFADDAVLAHWLEMGHAFATTLPPKESVPLWEPSETDR